MGHRTYLGICNSLSYCYKVPLNLPHDFYMINVSLSLPLTCAPNCWLNLLFYNLFHLLPK